MGGRELNLHPNYKLPKPKPRETKVRFTLRCAAHLVSPPQELEESTEIECINLSKQICQIADDVEELWKRGY